MTIYLKSLLLLCCINIEMAFAFWSGIIRRRFICLLIKSHNRIIPFTGYSSSYAPGAR